MVVMNGSQWDDKLFVDSIPSGITCTVNTGAGNDSVWVAEANGNLDSLHGTLTVNGGDGNDAIMLFDSSATFNGTYSVNDTVFTTSGRDFFYSVVCGPSTEYMHLDAALGTNSVNVLTTKAGGGVGVRAHGVTTVNVGTGNLDYLPGSIDVTTQAGGAAYVNVLDQFAAFNDTYTLTTTQYASTLARYRFGGLSYWGNVRGVTLNAETGNNEFDIYGTAPNCPVTLDANDGTDLITVNWTDPSAPVVIKPSTGNDTAFVGYNGAGKAIFSGTQRLAGLTIGDYGSAQLAPGGSSVLTVGYLAINGTGRLDLTDETMIIDYSDSSTSPFAQIDHFTTSGFFAGAWNGAGINSSTAAADSSHRTGVGIAEARDLFGAFPATFAGASIDRSSVLIRYTLYGDVNLDRRVDLTDFTFLAANFNSQSGRWSMGDFNFDDRVDLTDFTFLATNFNQVSPASSELSDFDSSPLLVSEVTPAA
jgi:hypothetical protein